MYKLRAFRKSSTGRGPWPSMCTSGLDTVGLQWWGIQSRDNRSPAIYKWLVILSAASWRLPVHLWNMFAMLDKDLVNSLWNHALAFYIFPIQYLQAFTHPSITKYKLYILWHQNICDLQASHLLSITVQCFKHWQILRFYFFPSFEIKVCDWQQNSSIPHQGLKQIRVND